MDPVNVQAKFEVRTLPVPEVIATEVLVEGCKPPILGKRRM